MPHEERAQQKCQQQRRATGIADPQRTVREVGQRRPHRRCGDNRCPIQHRVKLLRSYLCDDRHDKDGCENSSANEIAQIQRHRNGISASFSKRRGGDLDDPENQRNLWNLAQALLCISVHFVVARAPFFKPAAAISQHKLPRLARQHGTRLTLLDSYTS